VAWVIVIAALSPAAAVLALLPNRLKNQQMVINQLLDAPRAPSELAYFLTLGRGEGDIHRWYKKWEKYGYLTPIEQAPAEWRICQLTQKGQRVLPGQRKRFYIGLSIGLLSFAGPAAWLLAVANPVF
jgi:hypothetical protein